MTSDRTPDLAEALRDLALRGLADAVDDFIARATKARLEALIHPPQEDIENRAEELALGRAPMIRFTDVHDNVE